MTPEQFAYWLQGCCELNPDMEQPTPAQWKAIKDHLATVFTKVTPTGEKRWRRPPDKAQTRLAQAFCCSRRT